MATQSNRESVLLPLLPLRDYTLQPGVTVPLFVGRVATRKERQTVAGLQFYAAIMGTGNGVRTLRSLRAIRSRTPSSHWVARSVR